MLIWRVLSSIVGIPLLLGFFYLGGWYVTGITLALTWIGVYEFHNMYKNDSSLSLTLAGATLLILAARFPDYLPLLLTLCLLSVLTKSLFSPLDTVFKSTGGNLLIIFYLGLFGYAITLADWDYRLVFWLFFINWGSDIFAYAVGCTLGKHPLAPRISPKKSWEGFGGALLGGVGGAFLGWYLFYPEQPFWLPVLLGLGLGVSGQVGDLIESLFKRAAAVKDSGILIPGHGGVLDRFDSFLFNLPLMYYGLILYNYLGLGKPL